LDEEHSLASGFFCLLFLATAKKKNKEDTHRKRARQIGFADTRFGGSATALPPLKFQ
jgi:hypothetical protein